MAKLQPSGILEEVRTVLAQCNRGKGTEPTFLTAYQILDRLAAGTRTTLLKDHGGAGTGSGVHYGAASAVATACELLAKRGDVTIAYLDTKGIEIAHQGNRIEPSYGVCGLYRLNER